MMAGVGGGENTYPYQTMQTMARMKMKKYAPYIPMLDRARTGLVVGSVYVQKM